MNRTSAILAAAVMVVTGVSASAQQAPSVAELLPRLSAEAAVIGPGATGDHRQHFVPTNPSTLAPIYELNRVLALQAGAFGLGPSAFGATVIGPDGRVQPVIGGGANGSFTLGDRRLALAFGYQATTFDTVDGLDLRGSDMNLFLPHTVPTGDESDRDMMQQIVSLRLNRKIFSFALTYGLGARTDVGVIVPIVQVAADARVTTRIVRTASSQRPAVHQFDPIEGANRTLPRYCSDFEEPAVDLEQFECHGSSTARGIGDIVLRARHRLFGAGSGVAVGADVRLPTGSTDNFIGLGAVQVTPALTMSAGSGRLVSRARVDYTWSDGELSSNLGAGVSRDVSDSIGAAAGLDAAVASRVTLAFDVAARRFDSIPELASSAVVFPSRGPGALPSAPYLANDALSVLGDRSILQIMGAAGIRVAMPGDVLAQMSVLVPVGDQGLQPGPMAVFSVTRSY